MLSIERQQKIIDILKDHHSASVNLLCKKLFASEATVRRDLAQMEENGLLNRVRGGAAFIEGPNKDAPLLVRAGKNRDKKEKIAQIALRYVKDSSTAFMDSSSTVTVLAQRLAEFKNLTIISSGLSTIQVLNENTTAKIICCGGEIHNHSSLVGQMAIDTASAFCADACFISCCGLSLDCGTTEAVERNAVIKKIMCKNSKQRILLCDSTKFNQKYFCKACGFDSIDLIITDEKPDDAFCKIANCRIVYE